jgi:chemotaxis signal transduction protein
MNDVAAPAEEAPAGEFRHALRIGQRWFLLPEGMPAEVYPPLPCTRLPFTQHWCLGLASFRGDLAAVYDLAAVLNPQSATTHRYLLALGRRESSVALGIDEITGITVPPDTPTEPLLPLPGLLSTLICAGLTVDGIEYIALDFGELLRLLAAEASLIKNDFLAAGDV